jgi:hypothetical protein
MPTKKDDAVRTETVKVGRGEEVALVAAVNNGVQIGRYSKVIAALLGNVLAIFLAWLAVQFPQIAECRLGPDMTDACTVLGFTQAQITAALMLLINTYFVYQGPANDPPA